MSLIVYDTNQTTMDDIYASIAKKVLNEHKHYDVTDNYKCILRLTNIISVSLPLFNSSVEFNRSTKLLKFKDSQKETGNKTKNLILDKVEKFQQMFNSDDHYLYGKMLYTSIKISALLNFNSSSYEIWLPEEFEREDFLNYHSYRDFLFWNFKRLKEMLMLVSSKHLTGMGRIVFSNDNPIIGESTK